LRVEKSAAVRISLLTSCFQNAPKDRHKLGERIIEQLRVAKWHRLATMRHVVPNSTIKAQTLRRLRWVEVEHVPSGSPDINNVLCPPMALGTCRLTRRLYAAATRTGDA
jgi:hypothetical protein